MQKLISKLPLVALAVGSAVFGLIVARALLDGGEPWPPQVEQATVLEHPRPLPEFSLLDHEGDLVGPERLAGQWQLVFFGFTHCPDVCPITVQVLSQVRAQMGADGGEAPGVVFVSVDPARDDPQAVAEYLGYFGEDLLGLTGRDRDDIERFTREMGVAVRLGEPDEDGDYDVDHTPAVFLLNPQAELAAIFTGTGEFPSLHEAGGLAQDLRRILDARG